MTNLKDIEKRFDEAFEHSSLSACWDGCDDDIKSFYHKEVVQLLEGLKEKGHGGGNWRRLIEQLIEEA